MFWRKTFAKHFCKCFSFLFVNFLFGSVRSSLTARVFGDPLNAAGKTVNVEMPAIELRALVLSEVS